MLVAKPQPTVSPDADVIDADDVDQDGIGRAWWVPVAGKMVRAGGARTSLCSTVGARTAPRTPFIARAIAPGIGIMKVPARVAL